MPGDGCFQMNGQEFGTAAQYGIPFIAVVIDNGMYGTIRMHQENNYPHRVSATDLKNPDFAALARAYGGHGERVETTEEFQRRLRARARLRQAGDPALPARSAGDHGVEDDRRAAGGGTQRAGGLRLVGEPSCHSMRKEVA